MARQIKDIKDKNSGQLVYPRTHIKAVVVDGSTNLEDFIGTNMGKRLDSLENTKQDKIIKFTDITASNWVSDSTYSEFPYRCDLACSGVTANMYAEVAFAVDHAVSGRYAPICETGNNIVSIWSNINNSITIPTVIITT